jgi:type IV pilus assembly protein PilB
VERKLFTPGQTKPLYESLDKTLGQIMIEKNVISRRQLEHALKRQQADKGKYLGEILFEIGVPQENINKALDYYNKRKPIGQILLDLKVITPKQLEDALAKQKQLSKISYKPLGMLLVEMGYTTYADYLKALSKHFNMPIISLEHFIPSPAFQKLVGEKYAQQHKIVVLDHTVKIIKLVLAEPSSFLMDEIRRTIPPGKQVEFYLANPHEVEACLKKGIDPYSLTRYR